MQRDSKQRAVPEYGSEVVLTALERLTVQPEEMASDERASHSLSLQGTWPNKGTVNESYLISMTPTKRRTTD